VKSMAATTEFGEQVLATLRRYRLITQPLLAERFEKTETEVRNEIRRLKDAHLIHGFPFVGGQQYYRFTDSACRRFSLSRRLGRAPGVQALKTDYAILHFSFSVKPPREILTKPQLEYMLTGENDGEQRSNFGGKFYVDNGDANDQTKRLSQIYVDCRSHSTRLVQKAQSFLSDKWNIPEFRELYKDKRFMFAYVTESKSKADDIQDAWQRRKPGTPIRIHICPELFQL